MSSPSPLAPVTAASRLLVSVRGAKRTGKSSLQRRMCGQPFTEVYAPTMANQTRTAQWAPKGRPGLMTTITIIDVVSVNPRLAATGPGVPQAVIVMYDPRDQETVSYAYHVIEETSSTIPIALLTNFQDVITTDVHPMFRGFLRRCHAISTSMVTNLGLAELADWLELPLALSVHNAYKALRSAAVREVARLQARFASRGSSTKAVASNYDEIGFWSDDENGAGPTKRYSANEIPSLDSIELYAPAPTPAQNPTERARAGHVKPRNDDDDFMSAIIETATTAKPVIGRDEAYDGQSQHSDHRHGHRHRHKRSSRKRDSPTQQIPAQPSAVNRQHQVPVGSEPPIARGEYDTI